MRYLDIVSQFAAAPTKEGSCPTPSGFFGFPSWYKYLDCDGAGNPVINNISDIWSIAWAIVEMILYLGGIAAVFFIIYGGIQFITSQGNQEKTAQSRRTLTYAIAGLVISIISVAAVRFIAGKFGADVGV